MLILWFWWQNLCEWSWYWYVLIDAKSSENILICNGIHKFPFARNSLCVIFDKVDRFILKYKTKYLILFHFD